VRGPYIHISSMWRSARVQSEGEMTTRSAGFRPLARFAVLLVAAFLALPAAAQGGELVVSLPAGLGRVTSDIGGIDCPGTCSGLVPDGATATLTATPAPNYVFGKPQPQGELVDDSGWDNCDAVVINPSQCTVEDPSDGTTVTANFRPAALLLVVANGGGGSVTATVPNPQPGEQAEQTCDNDPDGGVVCPYPYLPGRAVTLTPSPLNASQPIWSDDDCLDGTACTLILDDFRRSITATFATQQVGVRVSGEPGRVVSTPAGIDCPDVDCDHDFATGQDVALTAEGADPTWVTDARPFLAGCDFTAGTVCHVIAERSRWTSVTFAGASPNTNYPPTAAAHFSVRKAGDGSGTVRTVGGSEVDCGSRCSVDTSYGERFVLLAEPSAGSRFARWRRGCGESASCQLTVGPTTRVKAEFARVASAASATSTVRKLQVALGRVSVRRSRGRYRIVLPLHLNLASTVSARVTTRLGRRMVTRRWQLRAGDRRLTLRVRARRGRYRLSLTIRSSDGQVKSIKRSLLLR
jgi:hypothetical protein